MFEGNESYLRSTMCFCMHVKSTLSRQLSVGLASVNSRTLWWYSTTSLLLLSLYPSTSVGRTYCSGSSQLHGLCDRINDSSYLDRKYEHIHNQNPLWMTNKSARFCAGSFPNCNVFRIPLSCETMSKIVDCPEPHSPKQNPCLATASSGGQSWDT